MGSCLAGFTPCGRRAVLWLFAAKLLSLVTIIVLFSLTAWTPLPAAGWTGCVIMSVWVVCRGDKTSSGDLTSSQESDSLPLGVPKRLNQRRFPT